MSTNPLQLQTGIKRLTAGPVDEWFGPYADLATALSAIPLGVRYSGMSIGVIISGEVITHRFNAGTQDVNLVKVGFSSSETTALFAIIQSFITP